MIIPFFLFLFLADTSIKSTNRLENFNDCTMGAYVFTINTPKRLEVSVSFDAADKHKIVIYEGRQGEEWSRRRKIWESGYNEAGNTTIETKPGNFYSFEDYYYNCPGPSYGLGKCKYSSRTTDGILTHSIGYDDKPCNGGREGDGDFNDAIVTIKEFQ